MLNPEVVKFPAPKSNLTYTHHMWDDPKRDITWKRLIGEHTFNTKVVLLLPDTKALPVSLREALTHDKEYYLVKNLPMMEFCTPAFLQAFVQKGQVSALSCDTCLDVENSVAMTPDGYLHLLVDKFVYQELHLHGTVSAHILRKPEDKFVIRINTREKSFRPGKSFYEKVILALSHNQLVFDFWITWKPNEDGICPSSVAKYFYDLGYTVQEQRPILSHNIQPRVAMPKLEDNKINPEALAKDDILEWIGCKALGIELDTEPTSVSELAKPKLCDMVDYLNSTHCSGFYAPDQIFSLIECLRTQLLQQCTTRVPWISITIYGHPDSLVSWGHEEHSYRTNGDNFYTLILERDQVHVFKASCSMQPLRLYRKANNNK